MPYACVSGHPINSLAHDHFDLEDTDNAWPGDLLPWGDPYIALLLIRLEQRFDQTPPGCQDFAAGEMQPVYGGFPLLDDGPA
jgi:hypothetical protein